jgi:CTP synthase
MELKGHPWFLGTQAHPEFQSKPNQAHPLFAAFIAATLKNKKGGSTVTTKTTVKAKPSLKAVKTAKVVKTVKALKAATKK